MNKSQHAAERVLMYLVLLATSALIIYPFLLVFVSSLKTTEQFMNDPTGLKFSLSLDNYVVAWKQANFGQFFMNSIFITGLSVLGISLLGAMGAYGLRSSFRGNKLLLNYLLIGIMIPSQSTIVTLFIFYRKIDLINTYTGLILYYIAHLIPLAIFIYAGFFRSIPKELEEAAYMDGCTELGTFWKIILPISRPVISTVIILTGLSVWNDFLMPMVLLTDSAKQTLPSGLLRLKGEFSVDWPRFFAAMVMIMIPIIVVFAFLQRQFIKGLTSGAVKG
ncbi:hypothetical protein SY83_10000 [Paenibacillus swuensis]|uniref:ABC transmembrane type-1 domain-containing protein n=1 Tax=Paenibacillus swuensis TaxID=1178515 RepID=A0A172THM1_9BACL|nr:carbohydrate ABC transporter permease [Paenibacillus swuensis]ANE46555.1 hypothetical protein SY83_10000 [Paenibacillus swuensis]